MAQHYLSVDEQVHVAICERVVAEARRLARERWPIASEDLINRLAARGIAAALMRADPAGHYTRFQT